MLLHGWSSTAVVHRVVAHLVTAVVLGGGRTASTSLLATLLATSEEYQKHGEKEADHGHEDEPDSSSPRGVLRVTKLAVNSVADNSPADKIGDGDDQRNYPGEQGGGRGGDGSDEAGADGEEECNPGEGCGDGVEDHDAGQGFGRVHGASAVVASGVILQNLEWVVADAGR